MIKPKMKHINHYFNQEDHEILINLSKETGLTKSALLRHLIRTSQYLDVANKIEIHNNLINEFLAEIHRIGININQIAYHLNTDITTHEESKDKLAKDMAELIPLLNEYKNKAFKSILNITPKKFKTIKADNE